MADGKIIIDTAIDTGGLDTGLDKVKGKVKDLDGTYETHGKGVSALTLAYGNLVSQGIMKAAGAMVDFAKKGLEVASSLQEVQNVVDTTFGQNAETINQFSKTAIESFGLTELQAKQFTSTLGAMTKSAGLTSQQTLDMSVSMTKLAGDMASFYNIDHDTAFQKIRAGLSGESEPLRQLGIDLSDTAVKAYAMSKGVRKSWEEMDTGEKMAQRYGLMMKLTSDAQGDFAKTSDSYANQIRLLQGELDTVAGIIGAALLPQLTELASTFTTFLTENEDKVENFGNIIASVVGVVTTLLEVLLSIPAPVYAIAGAIAVGVKTFSMMDKGMASLTGGLSEVGVAVDKGFDLVKWGKIAAIVVGVTVAVTMLAVALSVLFGKSNEMDRAVSSITSGVGNIGNAVNSSMNSVKKTGGYAQGTSNAAKGWAWVGESGAELVYFGGGETVLTNSQSMAYARSGLTSFNANNSTTNRNSNSTYNMNLYGADFVSAMKQAQNMNRLRG